MKNYFFCFGLLLLGFSTQAQDSLKVYLDKPEAWNYEAIVLPPSFAPEFPYNGYEELRFAPGMFNQDALDHFSYIMLIHIEDKSTINEEWLNDFFQEYYRGLCQFVGEQKEQAIDTASINCSFKAIAKNQFEGSTQIFDVFNEGDPLPIYLHCQQVKPSSDYPTRLLVTIAAHEHDHVIWQSLATLRATINKDL